MHEVLGGGEGILKIPTWQVSVLCGHRTRGLAVFVFCFIFPSCCSYYVQLSYIRYIAKKASTRQSDSQPGFSQWNIPTWRTMLGHMLCHFLYHPNISTAFRIFQTPFPTSPKLTPPEGKPHREQRHQTTSYKEMGAAPAGAESKVPCFSRK